jgi:hypothetical protein
MSNSGEIRVSIVEEITPGTTPASPTMLILPTTGQDMRPLIRYIESNTISPNRNRADTIRVNRSSGGGLPCELRWGTSGEALYQAIRAIMCCNEDAADTVSDATIVGPLSIGSLFKTGAFSGSLWKAGDVVRVTGNTFPQDGGYGLIDSVSAPDGVSYKYKSSAGQVGGATCVRGARLQNAAVHRHFTVEIARLDIGKYVRFKKSVFNTASINIATGQISTINFGLVAGDVEFANTPISGATYTAPTNRDVMDCVSVPVLQFSGVERECTSITLQIDNQAVPREKIGLSNVGTIRRGQWLLTGSARYYYDGDDDLKKYANGQAGDIVIAQEDVSGNAWTWAVPRAKWTDVSTPTSGPNQDDYFEGQFSAIADSTNTYTARLQRFVAP